MIRRQRVPVLSMLACRGTLGLSTHKFSLRRSMSAGLGASSTFLQRIREFALRVTLGGGAVPSLLGKESTGREGLQSFPCLVFLTSIHRLEGSDDGMARDHCGSAPVIQRRRITIQLTQRLRWRSTTLVAHWWEMFPRKIRHLTRKTWPPAADKKRVTHHPGAAIAGG